MPVEDVDGVAELVPLILRHLPAADEASEVGVGVGGGIELARGLLEVRNELVGFVNVRNGASSGAGDTANFTLGASLTEHLAGIWIIGVNDHSVWNISTELRMGIGGRVKDLSINATDTPFRIAGLDGGIGILGNPDAAHCEESRRGLGVGKTEAAFAGATAEGLADLSGLCRNDRHPLSAGVNDIDPFWIVSRVPSFSLGCNG